MRSWKAWSIFTVFLVLVIGSCAWFSLRVLDLDLERERAARQAERGELTNLAMWKMEYAIGTLLAQEAARPFFDYLPTHGAHRAYGQMFREVRDDEPCIPSPLLGNVIAYTHLHFQLAPDGSLSSPQAPRGRAAELAAPFVEAARVAEANARLDALGRILAEFPLRRNLFGQEVLRDGAERPSLADATSPSTARSLKEWIARNQPSADDEGPKRGREAAAATDASVHAAAGPLVDVGTLRPVWCGPALLLARSLNVDGTAFVQGCWLDWPSIHDQLLHGIQDLLPGARLVRAGDPAAEEEGQTLAGLPVVLLPGEVRLPAARSSALRLSLLFALGAVLVAALAVALLLHTVLAFSERRGAFVSAVTHELRTPLTTLRMYAGMLAEGRIVSEEKRQRYYETLQREADRLGHLVENVLAYSRLEARGQTGRREVLSLEELVRRVSDRPRERAEQAGMQLEVEVKPDAARALTRVDVAALEQIVFNLVDNACKYAAEADDKRIRLAAELMEGTAVLRVRDHGPGISRADARRLFRPFSKSAREAARSKPGVGLGLALCRRLARAMDGDLRFDASVDRGAQFEVLLPRAPG